MSRAEVGLGRRIRRYFFTGLIVLAPVGLTVGVLVWGFRVIDGILGGVVEDAVGYRIPGLGVASLVLAILLIGFIVRQAAGRQLLQWWNQALVKFPLTGRIYHSASQIVQAVVGERMRIFRRPVLIPYPTDGVWAIGFVTHESPPPLGGVTEPCVNVFVPTTPNPTSGFMLIVPTARIRPLEISIEEAMKLVISAGAVTPTEASRVMKRGLDLEHLLRDTSEYQSER